MKKVLVFAAHPDDADIGCGGSIAKHTAIGNEVSVCYMTSGDAGSQRYSKEELTNVRETEARNAAKKLGIKDITFLRNPDMYLAFNKETLIKSTEVVRKVKPNIVYVHHAIPGDHRDHIATNEIAIEAIGRANNPCFQDCDGDPWNTETILSYEVGTPFSNFNYVEDITDFLDTKIAALEEHKSQMEDINYSDLAKSLSQYRGIMNRKGTYCEAFNVLKISKIF